MRQTDEQNYAGNTFVVRMIMMPPEVNNEEKRRGWNVHQTHTHDYDSN